MKNNNIAIGVITIILIAGAFFVGKSYGQTHPTSTAATATTMGAYGRMGGAGGFGGRGGAGGATLGQVVSKDADSITVSIPTGGSKIILYSPTTTIMKSTTGAISDVAVGSTITATGTPNSDGSITATTIQIRPAGSKMSNMNGGTTGTMPAPIQAQ